MTEYFLQYIWKMKLFSASDLQTTAGDNIVIIQSGEHNKNAGPDFLNARIKIGQTLWAGNVEIHIKSSAWKQHAHEQNRAYDNVILHVVYEDDTPFDLMPTLVLKGRIEHLLLDKYVSMMQSSNFIPCEKNIKNVSTIIIHNWLTRLIAERIEYKASLMEQRLLANKNDWEETCYQLLARNFGTSINADPFERVARSLPLKILLKHINHPDQIEALLFGQAGFLDGSYKELYPHQLQSEYKFLKSKYKLEPIRPLEWKFSKLRPANFPTIRLSQFANCISKNDTLFSKIIELKNIDSISKLFEAHTSAYWKEHYHFKKTASVKSSSVGKNMIDLILINTIAPLLFLYGKTTGSDIYKQHAIGLLEKLGAEKNSIIAQWGTLGIKAHSASETQALLHLKKDYCDAMLCLQCAIGHQILKSEKKNEIL